jgi:hypothetical protein
MNKQNISYWIVTALMSAFLLMGAVADVSRAPAALAWFVHLGYPSYLLPFIGVQRFWVWWRCLLPVSKESRNGPMRAWCLT